MYLASDTSLLLTLIPDSWLVEKAAQRFGVIKYQEGKKNEEGERNF